MTTPLIGDEQTTRLVLSAQEGDAGALERLCERYLPRVRQIIALKLGCTRRQLEENEDLVQEAFVKILGALDTYEKYSTARFYNWVSMCVINLVRDRLRKKDRETPVPMREESVDDARCSIEALIPVDDQTPSRVLAGEEGEAVLEQALLNLPEHQRELITLRCFCEMSNAEIAEALGFESESTVRVNLHRVRLKLKEEIERLGDG